MSKNEFLKQIEVKNPCSQDWDEMTGNDQVRFCSHCNLNVNNLSAMTRKQALKIVRESNGRICVRYVQNPVDKTPVFSDKLYQITRRAGIAAGFLGASLSLSTLAYAQGEPVRPRLINNETEISQTEKPDEDKTESRTASLSGTLTDSRGNFASGVSVTLTNLKTNESFYADTNVDGFYEFKNVSAGTYKLFVLNEKGNVQLDYLEISEASENRQDLALTLPTVAEVTVELPDTELQVMGGAMISTFTYYNPLSSAVSNDDLEEVKNLIAKGADVNGREKEAKNITPIFLAVENGNLEIAETLLNFGAKINARDDEKQTPLMKLDEDASAEIVRLLVKHGAKVNQTDKQGNTALILAAESATAEVLQELINSGAEINVQNKEGTTALMRAAYDDDLEKVKILLLAGAEVNFKNSDGETAWDQTSEEEIEKLLESYGAIKSDN